MTEGADTQSLNPEARIENFTNSAQIKIRFTETMEFPEGTLEKINGAETGSYARMLRSRAKGKSNIETFSARD